MREYVEEMLEDYQRKKKSITALLGDSELHETRVRLRGKASVVQMVIDDLNRVLKDSENVSGDQG